MKTRQLAVIAIVVVAVGVGAFFGGRAAGEGTPTAEEAVAVLGNLTPEEMQEAFQNGNDSGVAGFPGGVGGSRVQGNGNVVSGSIIASDASGITVATADGSSTIVLLSGSTTISKTEDAGPADLATGEEVLVTGTMNDDGTLTATRIQLGATPAQIQSRPPGGAGASTTVSE